MPGEISCRPEPTSPKFHKLLGASTPKLAPCYSFLGVSDGRSSGPMFGCFSKHCLSSWLYLVQYLSCCLTTKRRTRRIEPIESRISAVDGSTRCNASYLRVGDDLIFVLDLLGQRSREFCGTVFSFSNYDIALLRLQVFGHSAPNFVS